MKHFNFFVALVTLSATLCQAQPVISRSNVNTTNFTSEFLYAPADGFVPGDAGADQVWDFSDLDLMLVGNDTTMPVASTPYAATFPTANYCYKYDGIFGGGDRYYYHHITATKYDILSIAYNGTNGDNYNADPRTFMIFPYAYNDVYTDTYVSSVDMIVKNVTATYDAYGTIIMPYGTFDNVIRQKIVTNGVTDYIWFNVNPFYPIVQTVLAENGLGIVKNTTLLGVDDLSKTKFTVYPNPTSGLISIGATEGLNEGATVTIYNNIGQKIFETEFNPLNSNAIDIDISSQPAGLYFVTTNDKKSRELYTQKLIKK
ncbi:MAG: hypothetical protein CFE23_11345 [Flavobacterium sp. BFFFF1]|uniref:T9SS type A sorting domain-containing protein n=1 Tax=Flavobacterium sp. BFFFF1 TaxID=2015557 RepID=UPI000BD4F09D|nr:T9SS type A sorting domain-containing protein [Flavobacterium sp. BFFFF1]OYU79977.1 MAG: hypothetical protein CFE23_11345 [Flavobacterium sp. BFFFF1]